ncbi:MAG: macrocin O-methyltransferase [Planctomycetota bacterium]|nr:macrocin O-methyltransferase [Planctomycetota bacterium]
MTTLHNHDFLTDPKFQTAYKRGVKAAGSDYGIHWRAYVALWAAQQASLVEGDFVECGVNRGFMSSSIMASLDWNTLDRDFYLLDTYQGLDERFVSEQERDAGALAKNAEDLKSGFYVSSVESVRTNFAEWPRAVVVQGAIPESLSDVPSETIAFLHIDLNCSPPEIEALKFFWPKLSAGAVVLFDDYAYVGYELQKAPVDEVVAQWGHSVLSMPTGQGLLVKSAS